MIGIIPGVENMPLQIRRGTEAERTAMTQPLAQGELLYVTNDQRLYIGNGSTLGGVLITGYTNEDAQDATAQLFSNGTHSGITFTYNDSAGSLSAVVDLANYQGTIGATSFKGSIVADDSTLLVDGVSGTIVGPVVSNVTGNLTGNVIGNITGIITGTAGSTIVGNITGNVTGNVTGNTSGFHTGDVKGSVFADDSSSIIDGDTGNITSPIINSNAITAKTLNLEPDGIDGESGLSITTTANDNDDYDLFTIAAFHNGGGSNFGNSTKYLRGRGTNLSPAAVQTSDYLHKITFNAVTSSTTNVKSAEIVAQIDSGSITATIAPSKIILSTMSTAGALVEGLTLDSASVVGVNANQALVAGASSGQVDTGSVVSYVKIKVGTTAYAIPLYAIRP